MHRTVQTILKSLIARRDTLLQALGDFPKADPYEHGVQVGMYQGVVHALNTIEAVLNDEMEEDSRR